VDGCAKGSTGRRCVCRWQARTAQGRPCARCL
jgi:hypothetical protein